jgi:hypothetical protein
MPVKSDKPPSFLNRRQQLEAMMPLFLSDRNRRRGFLVGRQSGLRSTDEVVRQLQQQLDAERRRSAALLFNQEVQHKEIVGLLRENAQLRLDAARRDREEAFIRFEDPTATRH